MRRSILILTLFIVLLAFVFGCSSNGQNPLSPGVNNPTGATPGTSDRQSDQQAAPTESPASNESGSNTNPPITDADKNPLQGQPLQGSHELWGLYQLYADPENSTLEIVPIRNANLHLNALKFLEPSGPGMVQLAGPLQWSPDKTVLDLDVRLVHPFAGLLQFSGFDVKGILISKGTKAGFSDPDLVMANTNETRLLNPDGYTRWWNPREFPGNNIFSYRDGALGMKDSKWNFQCTLNGFKYFADSLPATASLDTLDQADRGVFRAGNSDIRHYKISLKGGLIFNYAIDASWEPPTVKPPVVPDDFPPEANQPEPWHINAAETENSLFFKPSTLVQGGKLVLDIHVYDWQSPLPPTQSGTVKRVVAEWPGTFAPTEATFVSDQTTYGRWQVELEPVPNAFTSNNDVEFIIWAESTDGAGYGGILDPDTPLIAVNRFSAAVSNNSIPVVMTGVDGNAGPGLVTETYSVTAIDPDGDPLTYLWSVEPTGNPYNFDDPGNGDGTIDIDWSSLGIGDYTVQAQVSDGTNQVEATALDVSVGNTPPSLGPIEGLVDVTAIDTSVQYTVAANDPDIGQTLTYTWSFELHGDPENFSIPGSPIDGSMTVDYSGIAPDQYDINVRVSDGFASVDGTPILVTHANTLPTVEDVTGKTPVTSADTDELYQAVYSDPDKTQTLSFKWSIVPAGDPESFTIDSNPDGSLKIDWSTHPVGSWDVNIQANDGIGTSTGTKLTVVKNNTPPIVGSVEGPDLVSKDDTAAHYSAPISDIDPDQTVTALWSVVPSGDAPNFVIPSKPDKSVDIDWSGYLDGYYDVNVQADDGYAQVEGSLIIVHKQDNQPPDVGQVQGPTPVHHSDLASEYTASISDPDADPLTVLWSIVPHGSPASFVIPGSAGNPLVVDWSTYPVLGDYDINVQADDGVNPPVQGTLLVVSLLNTPPEAGNCDGPTDVTSNDTAAHYTLTYSDIDPGQTLAVKWSVVPQGSPANYSLNANPDGSMDFNWALVNVGDYDVSVRVSDGIANSFCGPFAVHKSNLPPTVGAVSGKSPVTCSDTAANYSAPISDPDPTQILQVTWSVVPTGNSPNYVIPAKPDKSVNINWTGYAVGSYDVNVQVYDGFVTVQGTLFTVVRMDTAPGVGAVSGPTSVYCNSTASKYQAPISDCDTSQTLTILWSMMPWGMAPVYTIPANPDGSVTFNWWGAALGDYDIRVRADDGMAQTESGGYKVTKLNTPPTVGSVTGPTPVYSTDISDYNLVPPAADCDTFQTLSYLYSIVPKGSPPDYEFPSVDGSLTIDWSNWGVGQFTIGCLVSDGIAQVYASPLDVVVMLKPCSGHAHTYVGTLTPNPYSIAPLSILPRRDIAFLDSGNGGLKGLGVAQIGPSTLGVFDADSSGGTGTLFTYFLGKRDAAMSIDTSPIGGRILTVTLYQPSVIKIIDSAIIIGPCIIGTIDTGNPLITWVAIDFEANGGFWAVQRDGTAGVNYRLVHYLYLADSPYFVFDPTGTMTITPKVGINTDIFDIAINQNAGYIYILEAGPAARGIIHVYKINPGNPAGFVKSITNVFSQTMDYDSGGPTGFAGYGDIDIDHADAGDERCRVLVYGRLIDLSSELIRFDEQSNVLDVETYSQAWPGFAINPNLDPSVRNLIMPDAATLQFWGTPSDW